MANTEWRDFEKYIEKRLEKLYPGYKCVCQKPSKTTRRRPDCFCVLSKKGERAMSGKAHRIIVECKDVKILEPRHIAVTMKKYQYPYYADRYDIIIPRRTEVPPETRILARKKKSRIRRVRS